MRDPKVIKILLTVGVTLLMLWAFFLSNLLPFGYRVRAEEQDGLQQDYETVSAELEKARRTVGRLPQLEAEQRDLQRQWKQAEGLLPANAEVATLLTQITRAGQQSGVQFALFRPAGKKPKDFYSENAIEVQVEAGYHQLGLFLSRIANLPRLVNVSKLKLNGKSGGGARQAEGTRGNSDRTMIASFTATAYSLREVTGATKRGPDAEKPQERRGSPRRIQRPTGAAGNLPPGGVH